MSNNLRFNHIFFFLEDYYRYMFEEPGSKSYSSYADETIWNCLLKRIALTSRLPKLIRYPFFLLFVAKLKRYVRSISSELEDKERPYCFIFHSRYWLSLEHGGYHALKYAFPGSKVVVIVTNSFRNNTYQRQFLSRMMERRYADLICTFDMMEAEKYGFRFVNLPSSDFSGAFLSRKEEEKWDVIFIGKTKERTEQIVRVWDELTRRGLRCAFFLVDVPQEIRARIPSGITCCDWLSYEECLNLTSKSRVILEIVENENAGKTLRVNEAVMLGKKLLTNNKYLQDNSVYYPGNMLIFEKPEEIPDAFWKEDCREYPKDIKERLSLPAFLKNVEQGIYEGDKEKR